MGVAELGVQAGYHLTGRNGGAPAGSIAPSLSGGAGFVSPAGLGLVLPAPEMLSRGRNEGLDGFDG
jgi:hypothetical protein